MNAPLRRALPCLLAVLALAASAFPTSAQEHAATADPFVYEAPTGWKPERIPFPLGFAPSLSYTGIEQLHFAPGMFDPKSENYFTYVFVCFIGVCPLLLRSTPAAPDRPDSVTQKLCRTHSPRAQLPTTTAKRAAVQS